MRLTTAASCQTCSGKQGVVAQTARADACRASEVSQHDENYMPEPGSVKRVQQTVQKNDPQLASSPVSSADRRPGAVFLPLLGSNRTLVDGLRGPSEALAVAFAFAASRTRSWRMPPVALRRHAPTATPLHYASPAYGVARSSLCCGA